MEGKIKRLNNPENPLHIFSDCFPGILDLCKGDKIREGILFFIMSMFNYGYIYPGLGYTYALQESNEVLHSQPGDPIRVVIFG